MFSELSRNFNSCSNVVQRPSYCLISPFTSRPEFFFFVFFHLRYCRLRFVNSFIFTVSSDAVFLLGGFHSAQRQRVIAPSCRCYFNVSIATQTISCNMCSNVLTAIFMTLPVHYCRRYDARDIIRIINYIRVVYRDDTWILYYTIWTKRSNTTNQFFVRYRQIKL